MTKVFVLNGPNLGRLGTRQPEVYGAVTYAQLAEHVAATGEGLGLDVDVRQTDHEGQMIEWLHEAADADAWVVINAGAWTHYSYAVADAAALVNYVEVHISNVYAREEFRHHSVLSAGAKGVIVGCGVGGYDLALAHIAAR
ncbi:MAG TPA: 3-dehydroquinate dehydratase [Tessaracoccus flavescens]|uniref:3-dehydroquinate dehydratase n=1 Tax=Tessaracoccus flavescens TaxID=399497 RepID=A0A921EN44_9ACTN|nr:3-dehydroquinate dehydratase [Tessaracoccus flavescens]